jgi:hypothetical protein
MSTHDTQSRSSAALGAAYALGAVSIVSSLIVSGYLGIACGILGGVVAQAHPGTTRTPAILLNVIGFLLGLSAQIMKVISDANAA